MKLSFLHFLLAGSSFSSAQNIRKANNKYGRKLKQLTETCTAAIQDIEHESSRDDEENLVCVTETGMVYKVTSANKQFIEENFKGKGKFKSGETELIFDGDVLVSNNGHLFSKSQPKLQKKTQFKGSKGMKAESRRSLQTGNPNEMSVLVVRVIAKDRETSASEAQLSDSVFGTNVDAVNLKSQYSACSHGKWILNPAQGFDITNGVTSIEVDTNTSEGDEVMRNAITAALNEKFSVSSPDDIADYVMYCLPSGTMSGIAYAYINQWNSVYNNDYCKYVSAQMHELGHNFGMAHSNEGGTTYADQSGMMGYSYSQNDGPRMCFNGAKLWQFGWFSNRHKSVDASSGGYTGELRSMLENPDINGPPIVIKVDNGNDDYFITFNRKSGFNSGTVEAGNQVTVTKAGNGNSYQESNLLAKLGNGGYFSEGPFSVQVNAIDLNNNSALVDVCYDGNCNPVPTVAPTSLSSCPDPSEKRIVVRITTDNYPRETSWKITNKCNDEVILAVAQDTLTASGEEYLSSICAPDSLYEFTISDQYGDGICCNYGTGSYSVSYDNVEMGNGGAFQSSETSSFGSCVSNPEPSKWPSRAPSSKPSLRPTVSPVTSEPTSSPVTSAPTSSPTLNTTTSPTPIPSVSPSSKPTSTPSREQSKSPSAIPTVTVTSSPISSSPTKAPVGSDGCMNGEISAEVVIVTDEYPAETSWTLTRTADSVVEMSGRSYTGQFTTYIKSKCIPEAVYALVVEDSYGDGMCCTYGNGSYELKMNGVSVGSGGTFGSSASAIWEPDTNLVPSSSPSIQGSETPTSALSSEPSMLTSDVPSLSPTLKQSENPTSETSSEPTIVKSSEPTILASDEPSSSPSLQGSENPTSVLSSEPSMLTSDIPSLSPTLEQSENPTSETSSEPTIVKSSEPTILASEKPSHTPTSIPSVSPSSKPTSSPSREQSKSPSAIPTVTVTSSPTSSSSSPTKAPVGSDGCMNGEISAEVVIVTDEYPAETSWTLTRTADSVVEMSGRSYTGQFTTYIKSKCIPEAVYALVVEDSYGDGMCCTYGNGSYELKMNGVSVGSGGTFGSSASAIWDPAGPSPTTAPTSPPTPSPSSAPSETPSISNTINCTLLRENDCLDYQECKLWGTGKNEFCGFVNQCEPFEGESCKFLPCCEGLVCSGGKKAKCELP